MKNILIITIVVLTLAINLGCKKQFGKTLLPGAWYLNSCTINGIDSTNKIKLDTNYAFITTGFAADDNRESGPIFLECYSSTKNFPYNGNQATTSKYKIKTLHWCWCNSAIFQNKELPCYDWTILELTETRLELELNINNKKTVVNFNKR